MKIPKDKLKKTTRKALCIVFAIWLVKYILDVYYNNLAESDNEHFSLCISLCGKYFNLSVKEFDSYEYTDYIEYICVCSNGVPIDIDYEKYLAIEKGIINEAKN